MDPLDLIERELNTGSLPLVTALVLGDGDGRFVGVLRETVTGSTTEKFRTEPHDTRDGAARALAALCNVPVPTESP